MSCGPIGNSDESEMVARRDQRFYLDVNNPASCTGNITRWRVCYYGPDSVHEDGVYWATYAVYRRINQSDGDAHYERVSEMFTAVRTIERFLRGPITDGLISNSSFNCYTDTRGVGDVPVTVQAGDIIGACVFNPCDTGNAERFPLNVVGKASGESLLEMGADECTQEIIPSNIQLSQLTTSASQRLHLYADIGKKRDLATNKLF